MRPTTVGVDVIQLSGSISGTDGIAEAAVSGRAREQPTTTRSSGKRAPVNAALVVARQGKHTAKVAKPLSRRNLRGQTGGFLGGK